MLSQMAESKVAKIFSLFVGLSVCVFSPLAISNEQSARLNHLVEELRKLGISERAIDTLTGIESEINLLKEENESLQATSSGQVQMMAMMIRNMGNTKELINSAKSEAEKSAKKAKEIAESLNHTKDAMDFKKAFEDGQRALNNAKNKMEKGEELSKEYMDNLKEEYRKAKSELNKYVKQQKQKADATIKKCGLDEQGALRKYMENKQESSLKNFNASRCVSAARDLIDDYNTAKDASNQMSNQAMSMAMAMMASGNIYAAAFFFVVSLLSSFGGSGGGNNGGGKGDNGTHGSKKSGKRTLGSNNGGKTVNQRSKQTSKEVNKDSGFLISSKGDCRTKYKDGQLSVRNEKDSKKKFSIVWSEIDYGTLNINLVGPNDPSIKSVICDFDLNMLILTLKDSDNNMRCITLKAEGIGETGRKIPPKADEKVIGSPGC